MLSRKDKLKTGSEGYVVYAHVSVSRYFKKVRNEQLYVLGPDGELISDMCGGTIGYYRVRITQRMLKGFVKSFVESELRWTVHLKVSVPMENILLKDNEEISRMMDRINSDIYKPLKELR